MLAAQKSSRCPGNQIASSRACGNYKPLVRHCVLHSRPFGGAHVRRSRGQRQGRWSPGGSMRSHAVSVVLRCLMQYTVLNCSETCQWPVANGRLVRRGSPYHLSRFCAPPWPPSQPRVALLPLGFTTAAFLGAALPLALAGAADFLLRKFILTAGRPGRVAKGWMQIIKTPCADAGGRCWLSEELIGR